MCTACVCVHAECTVERTNFSLQPLNYSRGSLHHHEVSNVHPILDKPNNAKISSPHFFSCIYMCREREKREMLPLWPVWLKQTEMGAFLAINRNQANIQMLAVLLYVIYSCMYICMHAGISMTTTTVLSTPTKVFCSLCSLPSCYFALYIFNHLCYVYGASVLREVMFTTYVTVFILIIYGLALSLFG